MEQISVSPVAGFDLFRLSKAKRIVDISPNTIRAYHEQGLPLYTPSGGRSVFVSKAELDSFIRNRTHKKGVKDAA
jgi:DNA-binding transcriptional MerR regulator